MTTIKDIAGAANVSSSTVSRILNHDDTLSVAPETREKVFEIAAELNYEKKSKPVRNPSYSLGIVQWFSAEQEIEDTYYLLIRQGIEAFCVNNNIHVVRTFRSNPNYIDNIKDVDGLICVGKFLPTEVDLFKEMCPNVIFLDMPVIDSETITITIDFYQAVQIVLDYLVKSCGHRQVGLLTGKEYLAPGVLFHDEREEFFIRYCEENDIEYKPFLVSDEFTSESGYKMMNSLIADGNLPTAIFATSDPIALGALRALAENGISVPDDISIVGFDNINITNFTNPPLTTIHAPAYDMGYLGAYIVFNISNSSWWPAMKIKLPCKLIERESCREI